MTNHNRDTLEEALAAVDSEIQWAHELIVVEIARLTRDVVWNIERANIWTERASKAEQERDQYAAVIENAKQQTTYGNLATPPWVKDALNVDPAVSLAARDAEKWREGHEQGYDSGLYSGDDGEPETVETRSLQKNPYRTPQQGEPR
jgi:hypothetical protein